MMYKRLVLKGIGIGGAVLIALSAAGSVSAGTVQDSGRGDGPECPVFQKSSPADGSVLSAAPTLHWSAAFGALRYEVCVDTTDDGVCDGVWTSVGLSRQYDPPELTSGTTYYWQVRAVTAWITVYANGGDWWSFTIQATDPPGPFGKTAPADASFTDGGPVLSWGDSAGAEGYEYCYDKADDGVCGGEWISAGPSNSAALSDLYNTHTYYWQVRAVNGGGETPADGGAWWSFTVRYQSFDDVPLDYWAWSWIERLYAAGITSGCGGGNYCPNSSVTRAETAIFLERGIHGSAYTPPAATGTVFGDVPVTHWAAAWIEQLYADGITSGCGGGNYCPNSSVTRAEMAIFLLRSEHGSSYAPPAATGTVFGDIPITHWAAAWIEQLAAEGITGGCGGGDYCPNNPVLRAEMAVSLVRTFDLP